MTRMDPGESNNSSRASSGHNLVKDEGQPDRPKRQIPRLAAQEENEQPVPDQGQEVQEENEQPVPDPNQEVQERVQEEDLKYGAYVVIMLFTPVTLCMVVTITSVDFFTRDDGIYSVYTPFHEKSDSEATNAWQAIANAGIMLGVIAVVTISKMVAYKLQWYWVISVWYFLASQLLLFRFSYIYLTHVLKTYNLPLDYISLAIIMWNFQLIGNFVII